MTTAMVRSSASLEWVPIVQDLFLEDPSPTRMASWLDGNVETHAGYVVVRRMGAVDGFDATILVRDGRAQSLSIWYRELEKPSLAQAQALLGSARQYQRRMFDLVFDSATRPIDRETQLEVSCSADNKFGASAERFLVGIAITIATRRSAKAR